MNERKFRYDFNDTINPMRNCGADIKTTIHYLLPCRLYLVQRVDVLNGVYEWDSTLQSSSEDQLLIVLLYGSEKSALNVNKQIIGLIVNFLKASERFAQPLFWLTKFLNFSNYIFLLSINSLFFFYVIVQGWL